MGIDLKEMYLNDKINCNDDIAVIGLSCRFASAENKDEYWNSLVYGKDEICELSENRKRDSEDFILCSDFFDETIEYYQAGFLKEIDKFDNEFFHISRREASLMSPEQRIMLEVAYEALEDSGYGELKVSNSKTGFFLGHSTDFGVEYKEFIQKINPEFMGIAISGNLHSLIASRIAFFLNFRGPSMVIDTACSSALVAIQKACESIRNGECIMALAGAIKIDLLPLTIIKKREDELGITSKDGRARSFDEDADGTGAGEGAGILVLKKLSTAIQDRDNIYAVIKGGALNQDGKSSHLTSPNPIAQEEVIARAIENSHVPPESISYIETHGTGTKLGDPIEIEGIERAFRRYTDKVQFCAIGSVKSNIGHLDNAAGIASAIKAIMSLRNGVIAPSIHFNVPNHNIDFENSPVYYNDILRKWETTQYPRRCGVSSFGLSGTNCHIVMEEYTVCKTKSIINCVNHVLVISAKSHKVLNDYVWKYWVYIRRTPNINLDDLCYTAATGRKHQEYRLAIIFRSREELLHKIELLLLYNVIEIRNQHIYYAQHHIIPDGQLSRNNGDISCKEQNVYSAKANNMIDAGLMCNDENYEQIQKLSELYCKGSNINWDMFYSIGIFYKCPIPTYPFEKRRNWIEPSTKIQKNFNIKEKSHDESILVQKCLIDCDDRIIYKSTFDSQGFWILNEHIVAGKYIIPGTAYIDMVVEILNKHFDFTNIDLENIIFITPFVLEEHEISDIYIAIKKEKNNIIFTITSKNKETNDWEYHAEGKIRLSINNSVSSINLDAIIDRCERKGLQKYDYKQGFEIITSPRWDCVKALYVGNKEILGYLELKAEYRNEINSFYLHPSLMDEAVNLTIRSIGKDLYLPFSYDKITIYSSLPDKIYSYVKYKKVDSTNKTYESYDISITDYSGKCILTVDNYTLKRVDNENLFNNDKVIKSMLSQRIWKKQKYIGYNSLTNSRIVIFKDGSEISNSLVGTILPESKEVIEVTYGKTYSKYKDNKYIIRPISEDFRKLLKDINFATINKLIYISTIKEYRVIYKIDELMCNLNSGFYRLSSLLAAIGENIIHNTVDFFLIGKLGIEVTKKEEQIYPELNMMYKLLQGASLEKNKLVCRCIDIDDKTNPDILPIEIKSMYNFNLVAYRNDERYIQELNPCPITTLKNYVSYIKKHGTYVVTGGTGDLGIELANHIAMKDNCNIVLLHRSVLPPKTDWIQYLKNGTDKIIQKKLTKLLEIESKGSNIYCYQVDISDFQALEQVFSKLKEEFGIINGVFHLAGVAGDKFLINKSIEEIRKVINPKVLGAWGLNKLDEKYNFDYIVFFSSISALVAEAGQADYAAANSYMDSLTDKINRSKLKVFNINWPAWMEQGMAVRYEIDMSKECFEVISNKSAFNILDYIMSSNYYNVIVGKFNYKNSKNVISDIFELSNLFINNRIYKYNDKSTLNMLNSNLNDVTLRGKEKFNDYSHMERLVANVIGNVLEVKEINVFNSFTEIGGNSIIGVKVELELEKKGVNINTFDFLSQVSISELAKKLEDTTDAKEKEKKKLPVKNQDTNNKFTIMPFNEVLYKTCIYNDIIPIIQKYNKNLPYFLAQDLFLYKYYEDDPEKSGMDSFMDMNIIHILSNIGVGVNTIKHTCSKTSDFEMDSESYEVLEGLYHDLGYVKNEIVHKSELVIEDIINTLNKKRYVIILVDCFYEPIRKDTYNKEHWIHALLIVDYNEINNEFHVIEHMNKDNLSYKLCTLKYQDILNSYEGFLINFEKMNTGVSFFEFYPKDNLIFDNGMDVYKDRLIKHKSSLLDSIEELKKIIIFIKNNISVKNDYFDKCPVLIKILNNIVKFKQVEAFNCTVLLKSNYIIINLLQSIVDKWTTIRNVILKLSYASSYDEEKIKAINNLLSEIYILENDYIKFLVKDL